MHPFFNVHRYWIIGIQSQPVHLLNVGYFKIYYQRNSIQNMSLITEVPILLGLHPCDKTLKSSIINYWKSYGITSTLLFKGKTTLNMHEVNC